VPLTGGLNVTVSGGRERTALDGLLDSITPDSSVYSTVLAVALEIAFWNRSLYRYQPGIALLPAEIASQGS
jgi:hypothetical protein